MSQALGGLDDEAYLTALELVRKATQDDGIDKFITKNTVDVLVAPTRGPSFIIDAVNGDQVAGGIGAGWMAAIAGYPQITLPMGRVKGLPVGFTVMDAKWEDADVLATAYVVEQLLNVSVPPAYYANEMDVAEIQAAMTRQEN